MASKRRNEQISRLKKDVDDGECSSSDSDDCVTKKNKFANDGSFFEMFKKIQESQGKDPSPTTDKKNDSIAVRLGTGASNSTSRTQSLNNSSIGPRPMVGRRKGNIILKTGTVQKKIREEKKPEEEKTAWSKYMAEVEKYKSTSCKEDDHVPLVK